MPSRKRPEIWLVKDANEVTNAKGDPIPFYTYLGDAKHQEVIRRDGKRATLEELVELADQDAESCNAHDACGMHRLLGAVLYRSLGREKATAIMLDVAERGGLHGMNGLRGRDDSFADLGVGKAGHDWSGSFGK